ncbi:MAG: transglutaminase-like domain-containing protein [Bacteroidota bacterium]
MSKVPVMEDFNQYLEQSRYIDSNSETIRDYAEEVTKGITDDSEKAAALFYDIRDAYKYSPYIVHFKDAEMMASSIMDRDYGHCVAKASLLIAGARALDIPARLRLAIVKNHISMEKIVAIFKTDLIVCHGHAELFLNNEWIKVTPAFNKELCDKLGVEPLEFDGTKDAILQEFDKEGGFMEYVHDYGTFHDIPKKLMMDELQLHYPHIFEMETVYNNETLDLTKLIAKA